MASLEEKIADLEVEIAGYKKKLAEAEDKRDTAKEDKLLAVIASRSETLNRLLDQQRERARASSVVASADGGPSDIDIESQLKKHEKKLRQMREDIRKLQENESEIFALGLQLCAKPFQYFSQALAFRQVRSSQESSDFVDLLSPQLPPMHPKGAALGDFGEDEDRTQEFKRERMRKMKIK